MDGRLIIANERVETPEKLVSENPATLAPGRRGQRWPRRSSATGPSRPPRRPTRPGAGSIRREKRAIFKRAENVLARRAAETGRLIALEKGSPYPESLAVEVFGALQSLNYYGRQPGPAARGRSGPATTRPCSSTSRAPSTSIRSARRSSSRPGTSPSSSPCLRHPQRR
ncbi:MAG: hypothetical protein MZW92_10375 [Comamonadaceae bacterium]|nr:hypothetical protein [Comamonadaceae bacterium]